MTGISLESANLHMRTVTSAYENTYEPFVISTYQYWAKVLRVVDADTLDLSVSLGFSCIIDKRFRLIGINAHETFGVRHDSEEYAMGLAATHYVRERVPEGSWTEIKVFLGKREKYGRWLCEVFVGGHSLNAELLHQGHALPISA